MIQAHQPINIQHVIEALKTIHLPGATPSQIKIANDFLANCESQPFLCTALLKIYCETSDYQLQMSSILFLTNIIKRSWNNKRTATTCIIEQEKEQLRKGILEAYKFHGMRNYKHFNNLIRYLTRIDFPVKYEGLHSFVINSLTELINMVKGDIEQVVKSNQVIVVLSTCKSVLKQYNLKKIAHNEEIFLKYITDIVKLSVSLSELLVSKIGPWIQSGSVQPLTRLIECLRKVDKVSLYGIGSMPSLYQYKQEVSVIISSSIQRIQQFDTLLGQLIGRGADQLCQQIQKYLIGILEQVSRLQNYFPFAFVSFLKDYLCLIVNMLIKNVANPKYYTKQKLLSIVLIANVKPLTSFAYYMSNEEFKNSIYCRKRSEFDNTDIQNQCHQRFIEIYSKDFIPQLLSTIITQIMTAPHILVGHKDLCQDLVLQDVQIAIVDQVSDPTVYENCITLVKNILKCFASSTFPVVTELVSMIPQLKNQVDTRNRQILVNILQIILIVPYIYGATEITTLQIGPVLEVIYEIEQFGYLSRIIRKYHQYLSSNIVKASFSILARVVGTTIGGSITPQIIYQSALGLKTLMGEMDSQAIPIEVLGSCISNIVNIITLKQFMVNPTIMWPIINLLIKLIKSLYNINRSAVEQAAIIIVHGLSSLIAFEKNQELIVGAIAELVCTLMHCTFKCIKLEYPMRGIPITPHPKILELGKQSLVILEAAYVLIKSNLRNPALQNYDTIYRLWLTTIRCYPTIYQQQLYGFQLSKLNGQFKELFSAESKQLIGEDSVIFIQILQEYFITELTDLNDSGLVEIVNKCIESVEGDEKRLRIIMAAASLYCSYASLKNPIAGLITLFFKQLVRIQNKISPQVNAVRTYILLIIGKHIITNSSIEIYTHLNNCYNGNFLEWFQPYIWSMHFVSNKFAFKLNAASILKAITDFGAEQYAKMLTIPLQGQFPMDWVLKVITVQLAQVKLDFMYNSYNNIFKTLLPNEITPEYEVSIFRKIRLHINVPTLSQVIEADLVPSFSQCFNAIFKCLDWSSADLQQRVGENSALELCTYLGWPRQIT